VNEKLRDITGLPLARGEHLVDQTANADVFAEVSGILNAHACNLTKVANDLRLLNWIGEIRLPPLQAGSSIMPGKVNPVLMEAAMGVSMRILSNDHLISQAISRSSLQICEFLPVVGFALLESIDLAIAINNLFADHVDRIESNSTICAQRLHQSQTLITAFLPQLGYEKAAKLLKSFDPNRQSILDFLRSHLGDEAVTRTLSPQSITALGYDSHAKDS
jgi:aspartate ammonia-lyase